METTTQGAKKMRSDKHAPKNFDPADYSVVDYLDNKKPEYHWSYARSEAATEAYKKAVEAWQKKIFEHFPDWTTGGDDHKSIHQCNHCGHPAIRWVAVVEHKPTGAKLAFGEICANRCELPGRDAFKVKYLKTFAQKQEAMFEKMIAELAFRVENSELCDWLDSLSSDYDAKTHPFLLDMKSALAKYGSLTENQLAATTKFFENEKKFQAKKAEQAAAEDAPVTPLETGRVEMVGRIVSTKWKDGFTGEPVLKMLVKLEDNNKVWGTVPAALGIENLVGATVEFTATVTRSNDDEHFGFFKRPTGASVLTPAPVEPTM